MVGAASPCGGAGEGRIRMEGGIIGISMHVVPPRQVMSTCPLLLPVSLVEPYP